MQIFPSNRCAAEDRWVVVVGGGGACDGLIDESLQEHR